MDLSPDEDNFQGRLLHQAALWDNVELLQELIASGADVDARDARRRTALHAAALADRSRCLAALCAARAELDARADPAAGGETALHVAAERGHVDNILVLLRAGARWDAPDAAGDTPLARAERAGRRHAANALRDHRDAVERERVAQHAALRELVSRGEVQQLKTRLTSLGHSAGLVVNMTPGGANTLLYVASEAGQTAAVAALLEAGADGRAHPVTAYGPLYVACYHGHLEVAKMLLAHFPRAAQQETVEKWLPLHAACIGGHAPLVTLLLEYQYPEEVLNTYTDETGQWQYKAAFDVNALDVSGQSALYVACTLGNLAVVEALLAHCAPCSRAPAAERRADSQPQPLPESPSAASRVLSPQRGGISMGIHAIVSKLTGAAGSKQDNSESSHRLRPVSLECRVGNDSCVTRAVCGNNPRLLRRLLAAGARADAPAAPPLHSWVNGDNSRDSRRRSRSASAAHGPQRGCSTERDLPWTALAIAARAKNVQMVEMLLAHGATDPNCLAIRECARHGLADLLAKLLATKAYPDPDYKLNKSSVSETVFSNREGDSALTYSALCPSTPVMVNWRELRCQLAAIRMSWLRAAALRVNKRLGSEGGALLALTRLDLANNELRTLPPELFTLVSLRYLNAAQNKLERLPGAGEEEEPRRRRRRAAAYSAPVLQDLYLQDNRLEELPNELFRLPALATLDVSNNKLRALPAGVWAAPALRDLNAALNHLRDLPAGDESPSEGGSPVSPAGTPPQPAEPAADQFASGDVSKSSSRSPSIERSESDAPDDDDAPIVIANRAGNAVWSEARRAHAWRGEVDAAEAPPAGSAAGSRLAALNLSHNQFTCVPPALACRAPHLTRLNMAYNSLRSMSYVTSYPTSLRQLDLSHNEITCWPSLPQIENFGSAEGDPLACYCPGAAPRARPRSGGSVRSQLLSAACPARRHLRLEGLRTLILSNNLLTRIQLTTDDDGLADSLQQQQPTDDEWGSGSSLKTRLLFPLLSMLDVSCNLLRAVPPAIHELSNLSVLNISGNKDITELPPQMGLLSRLWNLNASGCSLQEPLRSMVRGGRYKSADVVGYLKSVLQEARPYTNMKLMLVGLQGIGKTSLLECLRQESAIQHRRKPTDHWAKRMGNKSSRRGNVSTVGVDIGTWVYEKQRSARGPVTFRTWDFGGQQEYYATHQYFLSRRSLYLVLWRAPDGRRGLAGALDWLRSIQARAPGSPVIMVATHYDQVANCNLPESESPEALQRLIRCSIMGAPDADKRGLPRVLDSLEVSCSTRHNIRLLADIIYSVAFSVKPPGSKEPLLEQLVPATYLALEECVAALAADLREPVLRHRDYRRLVTQYMQARNLRPFRDAAELHQATMFLHENGVLLHYDDATLKELYFLRPQWLCDVLAHVVTVREINPFAANGIMRTEDLAHVFKASPLLGGGEEAAGLGASLLNKFELALGWDARVLLVPPLLPAREPPAPQLLLRSRSASGARGTPRRAWPQLVPQLAPAPAPATTNGADAHAPPTPPADGGEGEVRISARGGAPALRRLLLVSYVPRGFWPRLCTRVLADHALAHAAARLYKLPPELEVDEAVTKALDLNWGWKLWKTGMSLACGALALVSLRELPPRRDDLLPPPAAPDPGADDDDDLYHTLKFRVRAEGAWVTLDPAMWACVELLLPAHSAVLRRASGEPIAGCQSISLEPNPETLAKVLALVSDHVDLLLEDWYPSLGTRFVHTSEGRCLITRLVPCPLCLRAPRADPDADARDHLAQAFRRLELGSAEPRRLRLSQESRDDDGDSGVGPESNASSRVGSVEGIVNGSAPSGAASWSASAWAVEECILAACTQQPLACALHGQLQLRDLAPDTLLLDVEEEKRARWEHITRGAVAGRGAFGTVLAAMWRRAGAAPAPVALKALQPVQPPPSSDILQHHAYKAALSRWEREPVSAACRAYCGLRQELGVLSLLRHAHVVPLVAVCAQPLALLLALAPMGALDGVLRQYAGCGARVGERAARALALQLAKALEYLHSSRVLYRDLKSENVLVWAMPRAQEAAAAELSHAPVDVHVKLGDYGISRLAPPSGTKGFGGTEGFMAPEIMRYNGEEEYNEKVDCFSFGMLLYEVMSLRQPFEGHEAVKEAVLEGARPTLTTRELQYPCNMLETMRRCWSGAPELRPSAAALVALLAAPECAALCDAAAARPATAAAAAPLLHAPRAHAPAAGAEFSGGWEVWYGGEAERAHSLLATRHRFAHHHTLRVPPEQGTPVQVTALCRVGSKMWLGDSAGRVSVYNASSCALVWSVRVQEAVGGAASPVAALLPLPRLQRVALALQCGRLFLVRSSRPEGEATFVLSELGAATELCCLAAVPTPHGFEVWAGGASLSAYSVDEGGARGADAVDAAPRVTLLAAHHHQPIVFAYSHPGTHVYQYSAVTRQQTARLDVSKLVPCSESLHSIGLDEHLGADAAADRCQVTALCAAGDCVYAGTARGGVLVADAATLRPLTVFRPYQNRVTCIVPLISHEGAPGPPMLATLGDTYRPLLNRFQPPAQQNESSPVYNGFYCLLWRAHHWLPD